MSERLRDAFQFWWRHLPAIALISIPFSLLVGIATLVTGPALIMDAELGPQPNLLTLLLTFGIRAIAEAALIGQLAAIYAGKARSLTACTVFAITIAPAILLTNALIVVGASIGLLLFIVPGIWIYVRLALAAFAVALERQPPLEAVKTSFMRTAAIQWELIFAWLMLMLLLLSASNMIGAALIAVLGNQGGVSVLLEMITGLGGTLLLVLLYRYYILTLPDSGEPPRSTSV